MDEINKIFEQRKHYWETAWGSDDYSPGWLDRGIAPELIAHYKNGWLPATGKVLDIGCGKADTAAWFVSQGFEALGFDIAEKAIEKAVATHGDMHGKLTLLALDICQHDIPGSPYDIIIDRGCLHQIPPAGMKNYLKHIDKAASNHAKLVLFCAAYRDSSTLNPVDERKQKVTAIINIFKGMFKLEKAHDTFLDKDYGKGPSTPLPGIAFWLSRV